MNNQLTCAPDQAKAGGGAWFDLQPERSSPLSTHVVNRFGGSMIGTTFPPLPVATEPKRSSSAAGQAASAPIASGPT